MSETSHHTIEDTSEWEIGLTDITICLEQDRSYPRGRSIFLDQKIKQSDILVTRTLDFFESVDQEVIVDDQVSSQIGIYRMSDDMIAVIITQEIHLRSKISHPRSDRREESIVLIREDDKKSPQWDILEELEELIGSSDAHRLSMIEEDDLIRTIWHELCSLSNPLDISDTVVERFVRFLYAKHGHIRKS